MRVSSKMEYSDFIRNLELSTNKVQKTMNQLSSLKEVNKASDNPLLVAKILDLNVSIAQNKTYGQTISDANQWSRTQDSALDSVSNLMLRVRDLIESSANAGTVTSDSLAANKREISESISGIVDALNTNFDGRYVFGGSQTQKAPFSLIKDADGNAVSIQYLGNTSDLTREISDGVDLDLATNGSHLMNSDGTSGVAADGSGGLTTFFSDLISTLDNGDPNGDLSTRFMKEVDDFAGNFTNYRAKVGSIENRLQSAADRNDTEKNSLAETLSNKQDVDVAQKYMEYQNQMLSYQSTLAMGTQIMQTTILDYLK
ncbi:flagellar hook-associated protein FlgL [Ligilactobacillus salitolerans]|uniref:Flagellar hook-associated protein FlgL n=1 Tax=Ligilactobacillus salitolerans TaxID=1808352 RepID=A0A401ITQ3_9LACO|nr:flagellar hook-associated protein FlgL [Ligilactobacillus salitolerans]GBG94899.1 flagellar hook-associated protein FlgL [Ligilactobacillus salitolerans]